MEDYNFNSADKNDADERKSRWEVDKDDDDNDIESSDAESPKSLFRRAETAESEDESPRLFESSPDDGGEEKSLFDISQEGLLSGLLNEVEDVDESSGVEDTVEESLEELVPDSVEEEFVQVVEDKIQESESIVVESPVEEIQQVESTMFLNEVEDLVVEGTDPDAAIDRAAEQAISHLETAEESPVFPAEESVLEIPEPYQPPGAQEVPSVEAQPLEDIVEQIEEAIADEEPVVVEPETVFETVDTTPEDVVEEPPTVVTPASPPPPPPPPPTVLTPIGGPPPPPPPPGGGPPGGPPGGPAGPGGPEAAPDPTPELTTDDPDVERMNEMYYRQRNTGNILAAGAVGYMVGRRGGRKRTEARMQPEIDAQEKTIDELKKTLDQTEADIKKQAREAIEKEAEAVSAEQQQEAFEDRLKDIEENIDSPEDIITEHLEVIENNNVERVETVVEKVVEAEPETIVETVVLNEADQEKKKEVATASTVEEEPLRGFNFEPEEEQKFKPIAGLERTQEASRDARTMRMYELLEVADNIMLENHSLKDLYENGKIDAVGLRRVVNEYLRGDNYERLLRRSLEEEQIAYEQRAEELFEKVGTQDITDSQAVAGSQATASSPTTSNDIGTLPSVSDQTAPLDPTLIQPDQMDGAMNPQPQQRSGTTISTNAAIVLGILAGLVIVISVIFFSR